MTTPDLLAAVGQAVAVVGGLIFLAAAAVLLLAWREARRRTSSGIRKVSSGPILEITPRGTFEVGPDGSRRRVDFLPAGEVPPAERS